MCIRDRFIAWCERRRKPRRRPGPGLVQVEMADPGPQELRQLCTSITNCESTDKHLRLSKSPNPVSPSAHLSPEFKREFQFYHNSIPVRDTPAMLAGNQCLPGSNLSLSPIGK
eukprot:TRINITY_DN31072_c0_g1_i2.p1 TRINITY_DN31072_c0_g1~~TRINITY_DN31072_c0_g1_i2.p1  ORF type:complete len:113 (+),score=11.01 TRINITY_DN31072_c0_g1_i2:184-522(+)